MAYFLTEEQELIRNVARDFVQTEVAPRAKEIDLTEEFPTDLLERCKELGFLGILTPEEFGGLGADMTTLLLVIEEVAKELPLLGLLLNVHVSLGCNMLARAGTEEQKQKYLVPLSKGEKMCAFGVTEPSAGSDMAGSKTFAVPDGNDYVINGSKCLISYRDQADLFLITTVTKTDKGAGISGFIVEKGTPGLEMGKNERKLGFHGSSTGDLYFRNMRVPKTNMLGEVNQGFKVFASGLNDARITAGCIGLGVAQGVFEKTVTYAKEREQFGRPIAGFEVIQFYIADMATEIELAHNLIYNTARLRDSGMPYAKEAAMCKLYCGEMAFRVANTALQIHGGNGYISDFGIDRYLRDARLGSIGEGTSEMQKVVISRMMLK